MMMMMMMDLIVLLMVLLLDQCNRDPLQLLLFLRELSRWIESWKVEHKIIVPPHHHHHQHSLLERYLQLQVLVDHEGEYTHLEKIQHWE